MLGAQPCDLADALLGHPPGRLRGGDRLRARDLEDPHHVEVDAAGHAHGPLPVVARHQLVVDVDQAAGVDDEVGGVEDAAVVEGAAVPLLLGELVVGGPGHHLAPQPGDRLLVQGGAQGAGGEDVAGDLEDLPGGDDLRPQLRLDPLRRVGNCP